MTCDSKIQENYLKSGNEEFKRCPVTEDSQCILSKVNGYGMVKFKCIDMGFGSGHGNWTLIGNNYIIRRIFSCLSIAYTLQFAITVDQSNKD